MAIQDTKISELELFLKNSYSLDDLTFSNNFGNHLTTDKIDSQYYSETYKRFAKLKISKTAFINIPNKLLLRNIEKYDPNAICGFYYNSVKLALDKLFRESNRVFYLITFLNDNKNNNNNKNKKKKKNNKHDSTKLFEQSEKYLQKALFKPTTLMEYFEKTILTDAAEKASANLLLLMEVIELMEEYNHTANEIALILDFADNVREFAAEKNWLLNVRLEGEKIQSLMDEISLILKEDV